MNDENINKVLDIWASVNIVDSPIKQKLQLEIVNQIASTFALGKYYYMVFNFINLQIEYVHPSIKNILGVDPKDFSIDMFFNLLHPDDLISLHNKESIAREFIYSKIKPEDLPFYKVVYFFRLKNELGDYTTILHQSRAISVTDFGKIQKVLTVHSDITFLDIPFSSKVSFLSQEKPCYFAIETDGNYKIIEKPCKLIFTIREVEIIKHLSEGKTFKEIAEILFVSPNTINYHKKNILKKSGCKNTTHVIVKCIREGII